MNLNFNNNHDFITLFERKLSEYTGAPYVVLTDSCTNALFLALKYKQKYTSELKNILEISIPNRTYISVPQTIIHCGLNPIYEDIYWNGYYELGYTHIFDCAVGFEPNMYKKDSMMCLSFQQKKAIKIGKGGAILLDNIEDYNILKRMAWDGRDSSKSVVEDINNIILGYHMNMIPDDAAKGILLLNQYKFSLNDIKNHIDYPNIEQINYFKH